MGVFFRVRCTWTPPIVTALASRLTQRSPTLRPTARARSNGAQWRGCVHRLAEIPSPTAPSKRHGAPARRRWPLGADAAVQGYHCRTRQRSRRRKIYSAAERSIIRRASVMTVKLERLEAKFAAAGGASERQQNRCRSAQPMSQMGHDRNGVSKPPCPVSPGADIVNSRLFVDRTAPPDVPPRESIETRALVFHRFRRDRARPGGNRKRGDGRSRRRA